MAYLQIITRTFGRRPRMLARNRASLATLQGGDWEQTLVVDEVGRGCTWANMNLATVEATGIYIWVLDDDDVCALPELMTELHEAARREHDPAVIMMRTTHVDFGTLPHDAHWRQAPQLMECGFSNFFIRGDVWNAHRVHFRKLECYEADYRFAAYLWEQGARFAFHDAVAAHYPQRSIGAVE